MNQSLRTLLLLFMLPCALLLGATVSAGEVPVVTGEHWTDATEQQKRAFILGMATIIELEQEFQATSPPAPGASLVPPMVNGLSDYTLEGILRNLDQWYADNPDGMNRAVVEVIWTEMALPNLQQ